MLCSNNNFTANNDGTIGYAPGLNGSCTYTLSVEGPYAITGYTFTGTATANGMKITPAAGGSETTFNTGSTNTLTVSGIETLSTTFTESGSNYAINATLTITVKEVDPVGAFFSGMATVQGYQTTGRGNNTLLQRISIPGTSSMPVTLNSLTVALDATTLANVSDVKAYITDQSKNEFYALSAEELAAANVATATATATTTLTLATPQTITSGKYLWLTATVKENATFGVSIDAEVTGMNTTINSATTDKTLSFNPAGAAKVFAAWSIPFVPTTDNSRFYRIPAMILDKDGNVVVAADRRNGSNADVGTHKVDITSKYSVDGGKTWSDRVIIAEGDGIPTSDTYGYGDPSLTRAPNGDLICFVVAGHVTFWEGQKKCYMIRSTDNGHTWEEPRNIYEGNFTDKIAGTVNQGFGEFSLFVTSGKGLTTTDNRMMLLACVLYTEADGVARHAYNHILWSDDNGESWTLEDECIYDGGDEAKLEQRPDGTIVASIRQTGTRGFNFGTSDGQNWTGQTRKGPFNMNACNMDILQYNNDLMVHSALNSGSRENLHIYTSVDGGQTWTDKFLVQTGGSAYTTMQKLPNGDLAVFFEDESYSAGNGYAQTYLTIPEEEVLSWYTPNYKKYTVKIAENGVNGAAGTTGPDYYGSFNSSNTWSTGWTSGTNSALAGVTITSPNAIMGVGSGDYSTRAFNLKPSAVKSTETLTLTAPDGYVITGYTLGGRAWTSAEPYKLTAANGTSVTVGTTESKLIASNVNAQSTTITFEATGNTNNRYMVGVNFTIDLQSTTETEGQPALVTYNLIYNNNTLKSALSDAVVGAEVADYIPAEFNNSFVDLSYTNTTIAAGGSYNVTATLKSNAPTFYADYSSAEWKNMTIRNKYVAYNETTTPYAASASANGVQKATEEYLWALGGNPYQATLFNKAAGATKTLGVANGNPTMLEDNTQTWVITANTTGGYTFKQAGTANNYLNDTSNNGVLGFWNSSDGLNDAGGNIMFIAAPSEFNSYVLSEIAPYFEAGAYGDGYFRIPETTYNTYNERVTAGKTSCSYAEYKELYEATQEAIQRPATGYYRLRSNVTYNNGYSTLSKPYMYNGKDATNLYLKEATEANKDASTVMYMTRNQDGTYAIQTQGKYIQSNGTQGATAANFIVTASAPGIVNFKTSGENDGLHFQANGEVVVKWDANSPASQWSIEDVEAVPVSLTKIDEFYYASLCVPFTFSTDENTWAYVGEIDYDENEVVMTRQEGTIQAGTPVILIGTTANATLTIEGGYAATPLTGMALSGTYFPMDWNSSYLSLGKTNSIPGFYKWSGTKLGANKAYIIPTTGGSGNSNSFRIVFDDDPTALTPIEAATELNENAPMYNLMGVRVSDNYKGIVIQKGKRFIKK